jgi:hypothetical protein
LQKKFKHAKDFGIKGNYNPTNAKAFEDAIRKHVHNPAVQPITGTYHGKPAIIYVDPNTGLAVITDPSGNFISGWTLSPQQLWHALNGGVLGGG